MRGGVADPLLHIPARFAHDPRFRPAGGQHGAERCTDRDAEAGHQHGLLAAEIHHRAVGLDGIPGGVAEFGGLARGAASPADRFVIHRARPLAHLVHAFAHAVARFGHGVARIVDPALGRLAHAPHRTRLSIASPAAMCQIIRRPSGFAPIADHAGMAVAA